MIKACAIPERCLTSDKILEFSSGYFSMKGLPTVQFNLNSFGGDRCAVMINHKVPSI